MRIVYLGSGEFGLECLDALAHSNHSLELIVTQPAQPAGRGKKTTPTAVAKWADAQSIEYLETDNVNSPEIIQKIAAKEPEVLVVIAFGQKISPELVNLPTNRAINVHSSLLPKYRGAAPINWAIIKGETETGISIITLAEKMDAGDILAQAKTSIEPDETAGRLHDRLAKIAAPLLLQTIDKIADGTAEFAPQDHSKATVAPKLKKSDGLLDFTDPAEVLERKIRGLWPWPGGSALYTSQITGKSSRVTIAAAKVVKTQAPKDSPPGALDDNLNVICGKDALKIIKIQPAGKPLMDFADFVNGRRTVPGDLFTKIETAQ